MALAAFVAADEMAAQLRPVKKAVIEQMIDPSDAFAITVWVSDFQTQCVLVAEHHSTRVIARQGLSGVFFGREYDRKKHIEHCIFLVPDEQTKQTWDDAIERFQQGSHEPAPFRLR